MTVFGTFQTKVGIALESSPGTPADAPAEWLPTDAPKVSDNIKYYADAALRGVRATPFGLYGMGGSGEVDLSGPFYPDSGGYFPLGVLGTDTVTTKPTATTTSAASTVGATSISLTAATGFAKGMAIMVGATGSAEPNIIVGITGTTATLLAPLQLAHASGAAVAGNNLHTMTLADTPKTATIWDYYGVDWRQYAYGTVSEWDLKWTAEAECTHTTKFITLLSQLLDADPGSESFALTPPFVGWQGAAVIGGTNKVNMESFEVDLKAKVTPIFAVNNTQSPTVIFAGESSGTAKATFIMESEAEYNLFREGLVELTQVGLFGPAPGDQRTGAAITPSGFLYTMTAPTATSAPIVRSKDYIEVEVNWEVPYNVTDGGPGQVQLTNDYTAYA